MRRWAAPYLRLLCRKHAATAISSAAADGSHLRLIPALGPGGVLVLLAAGMLGGRGASVLDFAADFLEPLTVLGIPGSLLRLYEEFSALWAVGERNQFPEQRYVSVPFLSGYSVLSTIAGEVAWSGGRELKLRRTQRSIVRFVL
jgi:hypothetical protein